MVTDSIRLQVAVTTEEGSFLQAEMIGTFDEINAHWARFIAAKYRKDCVLGGAVIQRADKPRKWDVPVGGKLPNTL